MIRSYLPTGAMTCSHEVKLSAPKLIVFNAVMVLRKPSIFSHPLRQQVLALPASSRNHLKWRAFGGSFGARCGLSFKATCHSHPYFAG